MGMMDEVTDTTDNKYRQWRNAYNILINAACFSCKWAETHDIDGKMKACALVHEDDPDEKVHKRTYCCRAWTAAAPYQVIGSGRNCKGGLAKPGRVKTQLYLHWWADNHGIFNGTCMEAREEFKRLFGGTDIFLNLNDK